MTRDEFDRWSEQFFAAFPGTFEWLNKTSPDPAATLGFWSRALERTDYGDALEAIDRLLDGRAAPIQAFDREKTPVHIVAIAGRCRGDRLRAEESARREAEPRPERTGRGPSLGKAFALGLQAKREAIERGESIAQAREAFSRAMNRALVEGSEAPEPEQGRFLR